LAALVLFMSQTGARVSEAINVSWHDIDLPKRTAVLKKIKGGTSSIRHLTDGLVARLYALQQNSNAEDRVFRYKNRHAVNERIMAVCSRAEIAYKPSHTCGRHAMANNALALGVDIKSTMIAGGWKSTAVFLETYVNPRNSGRVVADKFNSYEYDADL
jgi:integrase